VPEIGKLRSTWRELETRLWLPDCGPSRKRRSHHRRLPVRAPVLDPTVQVTHQPLLKRQFVVCPLQTASVFINFPVALGDRFPDRRDGDDAKRFIDQPPGAPFVAPRESFVRFRERPGSVSQHLPEQVELVDQFIDSIALLPADLSMRAGITFDRRLRLFEVLGVKRGTDPSRISGR
jgi:hypothetical protein